MGVRHELAGFDGRGVERGKCIAKAEIRCKKMVKGFLPQMAVLGRDIFGIAAFGERQCTAICLWNIGELEVGIDIVV